MPPRRNPPRGLVLSTKDREGYTNKMTVTGKSWTDYVAEQKRLGIEVKEPTVYVKIKIYR